MTRQHTEYIMQYLASLCQNCHYYFHLNKQARQIQKQPLMKSFAGTYLEFLETRIQITTFLTMWRRMPIDVLHPAFRYISGNQYIYDIYIYKIKDKDGR